MDGKIADIDCNIVEAVVPTACDATGRLTSRP